MVCSPNAVASCRGSTKLSYSMKDFKYYLEESAEIGFIEAVSSDVAHVSGLPGINPRELVMFETGDIGYVLSLGKESCEVLIFSKRVLRAGTKVTRTKMFLEIEVGRHLLGSTVNPFGKPVDNSVIWDDKEGVAVKIDTSAEGISSRKRINQSFETGVALVDLVLPLGKGQRQLIIGDRKSGKTNFLLQTLLTQASQGTICIYVAIGKKQLSVKKIEEFVKANGIAERCIVVASVSQDPSGIIYMTPYTGMAIAEYFREQGSDVLIILDDLTTHARYYREISLLIKRFPGRNSYPADIFYAHARLLERAGNFKRGESEQAITCLPVAETVQGDLSGFIQTNLMSMTDGHLYFDSDLFAKGRRPAIHPFLSVTRVGRQTQSPLKQTLNRELLSFLSLYEKMQNFTHFGADVSETVSNTLSMGDKVISFFEQLSYTVMKIDLQVFLFSLLWIDTWRSRSPEFMKQEMLRLSDIYNADTDLQNEVHAMVEKSQSFNQFLGEVRGRPEAFYQKLGLSQ